MRIWSEIFPERQLLVRSAARVRSISLPGWLQAATLGVGLCGGVGVGYLAAGYFEAHRALQQHQVALNLAQPGQVADASLHQIHDQYDAAVVEYQKTRGDLDNMTAENDSLRGSLGLAESRAKTAEQALAGSRTELSRAESQRANLQAKLAQTENALQAANARAEQMKLALEAKEKQLKQLAVAPGGAKAKAPKPPEESDAGPQTRKLDPAASGKSELEQLIASTGLDIDRLLARLDAVPSGQGGPYVALDDPKHAAGDAGADHRIEDLQKLVGQLPLAAPLPHYQLESGFGARHDPFNGHTAFHSGLDLSAPYRSPVYSTAPGTVIFTGVKDNYGRVVEIDHGHGIVTRYAHLHRILVARGQKVDLHTAIGELGSTGRSTGPHVHYEVIVDGTPQDPEKFLQAGKNVVQVSGH